MNLAPGQATVQGTIRGMPLTPQSVLAAVNDPATAFNQVEAQYPTVIILASAANACQSLTAHADPANSTLSFRLRLPVTVAATPGDYTIGGADPSGSAVGEWDDNATTYDVVSASSGTVHVSSVDSNYSAYAGTFDVVMATGEHLTGAFNAMGCTGAANWNRP